MAQEKKKINGETEEMSNVCGRCNGCGLIADTENGEPWDTWASLPPGSDAAVRLGIVKPISCPECVKSIEKSESY